MTLWYLKSTVSMYSLCPLFGLVLSSISTLVDYELKIHYRLCYKKRHQDLREQWRDQEMKNMSAQLLELNIPNEDVKKGFSSVMDEGRLPCAIYNEGNLQNVYYKNHTTSVEVTNFFYDIHGANIHAGVNLPGSRHDSKPSNWSGLTYPKLSYNMTPPGYAILCGSAFKVDVKGAMGRFVMACKTKTIQWMFLRALIFKPLI